MQPPEIEIPSPWMNAAGSMGYTPPSRWSLPEAQGIFVTNPISRRPRRPAAERAALAYPGGLLLHSGLPNPGFHPALRKYALHWSRSQLPVWVHLIPAVPDEAAEMVRELEDIEGISAVEIGVEPGEDASAALEILAASAGERPLVAALPLSVVGQPWLSRLPDLGVSAVTLSPPRGTLSGGSGRLVSGRMYGPSLFPFVLAGVAALHALHLTVIAGAGIYTRSDAEMILHAGAAAVQVDTALWRGWLGD